MKTYITVEAHFTLEEQLRPTAIIWTDGRRFVVQGKDKVLYADIGRLSFMSLPVIKWYVE